MKILFSILCGLVVLFVGGCAMVLRSSGMTSGELYDLMWVIIIANTTFLILANFAFSNRGKLLMGVAVLYAIVAGVLLLNSHQDMGNMVALVGLLVAVKAAFAFFIGYRNQQTDSK